MSVFLLCERALSLIRAKRLDPALTAMVEALNYQGLINANAQEEAVTCVRHFAPVRDSLFALYPWVFARRSAALSAGGAVAGWRYAYALPNDCVKVHTVIQGRGTAPEYERLGSTIATDASGVTVRYTAVITDANAWAAEFRDCFAARLAHEIAFAAIGQVEAASGALQLFQFLLSEAYRTGAIDGGASMDNGVASAAGKQGTGHETGHSGDRYPPFQSTFQSTR
ncbi:hypothetical protein FACS1894187_05080 [Synergistales bacterium]|nr:hypothetical protein FACS1894187_05080 [Synergistales bacterium]